MAQGNDTTTPTEAPAQAKAPAPAERATLGIVSFGLAFGITSAVFVFLIGVSASLFDWGVGVVAVLSTLYIGYSPTFVGSITGAVWAFVDGFLGGALLAFLYNRLLRRRR